MTDIQKSLFKLWFIRFMIVYEQLIQDGYSRDYVKNLFYTNRFEVGFVWSRSYVEIQQGSKQELNTQSKLRLLLLSGHNLFIIIQLLFFNLFRMSTNVFTRHIHSDQFSGSILGSSVRINIRRDFMSYGLLYWFARESKISEKEVLQLLLDYRAHFSDQYFSWALEDLADCRPVIFNLQPRSKLGLCRNVKIINFAGDIFKSKIITSFVWLFFRGEISGAQHGGGYGLVSARNLNLEMECYEHFYLQELKKLLNVSSKKKFITFDRPVCLLLGSMPVKNMDGFRNHISKEDALIIDQERLSLRRIIRDHFTYYYIREHPKSNFRSTSNVCLPEIDERKPTFATREGGLIVIEAPGTTAELNCIQFGMNYACVFDIAVFPLTPFGKEHYGKLKESGKLYNLAEFSEKFNNGP